MRHFRGRIVLILVVVLMVVNLGKMAVSQSYDGPGALAQSKAVVIPPAPTAVVAETLQQEKVIRYALIFRAAAYLTRREGPIHAGEFLIPAHSSLHEILDILRHGQPVEHQVTIPEGLTARQIASLINQAPAASGQIMPPAEGAVLPQTYDFTLGTKRAAILYRAGEAMDKVLAAAWAHRDQGVPLATPKQALILASIVQQETPIAAELPEIAAVYENRLNVNMKLQADPTVIYAVSDGALAGGAAISRADLENPSPYNTYLYAGLPPGPISAPGIAAIQAVLHPAASHALFFVATGTGGHVFTDNFQQQLSNIAKYRAMTGN